MLAVLSLLVTGCGSQSLTGDGAFPGGQEDPWNTGGVQTKADPGVSPEESNSSAFGGALGGEPPSANVGGSALDPELVSDPRYAKGPRTLLWSMKGSRILLTNEQIAAARQLCRTHPAAIALKDAIVGAAAYWAAIPDQELFWRLPDSQVCRAFNVSTQECPLHGSAVYQYGTYPWILNVEEPFTIECPIGHEKYPSNDFAAYYASGFSDPSLLTGPYPDDGRGWISPSGEKYWMVGYACHWNWRNNWLPAVTKLSQAYALTGDRLYARKTLVMLDRIAQVYPGMDYATQSRMGELTGGEYKGKILNALWETKTLLDLAVAYDLVFDAVLEPDGICLPWRSTADLRANIEANFLEEGLQAVADGRIAGNPSARATAVIVRQGSSLESQLEDILNHSGDGILLDGLYYALYNSVAKDGMPWLTSPDYGAVRVNYLASLGRSLLPAGINIYQMNRMRAMFNLPLGLICTQRFTPSEGDSGGPHTGLAVPSDAAYEDAYRNLQERAYAWLLREQGALEGAEYRSFEQLFKEPIRAQALADAASHEPAQASRFFDGLGLVILNNAGDTAGVSLFYGLRAVHGHHDRLNVEVYGRGRRLSPDLGYPDFMNEYVPGVYSWSKNTISHNTVMVDESKQLGNTAGRLLRFHWGGSLHVVDVDAAGSYPQATIYRRTLAFVEIGADNAYLVDVFRVRGGEDHVLSLHGGAGTFDFTGAPLPPPVVEGTLAGPNVGYGELYDDPILGQPGYGGPFYGYCGSGYSHLFNWQSVTPTGVSVAQWTCPDDPDLPPTRLRIHIPAQPEQEIVLADAYVSPLQRVPTVLKYILLRKSSGVGGNTFVVVWEMTDLPLIDEVTLEDDSALGNDADRIVVLSVRRGDAIDRISVSPESGLLHSLGGGVTSDGVVTFASQDGGVWDRCLILGGSLLTASDPPLTLPVLPTVRGAVVASNHADRSISVDVTEGGGDLSGLPGAGVRIFNSNHSAFYTISSAEWSGPRLILGLEGSDVLTGRLRLTQVDVEQHCVSTDTGIPFPAHLVGMTLLTGNLSPAGRILSVTGGGRLCLSDNADMSALLATWEAGGDVWVADFGVGDQIEIERMAQ